MIIKQCENNADDSTIFMRNLTKILSDLEYAMHKLHRRLVESRCLDYVWFISCPKLDQIDVYFKSIKPTDHTQILARYSDNLGAPSAVLQRVSREKYTESAIATYKIDKYVNFIFYIPILLLEPDHEFIAAMATD